MLDIIHADHAAWIKLTQHLWPYTVHTSGHINRQRYRFTFAPATGVQQMRLATPGRAMKIEHLWGAHAPESTKHIEYLAVTAGKKILE
jgi:hypothetical protein